MVTKLQKKYSKQPRLGTIALSDSTIACIKTLAKKHNTTMREIIRYLVDLAVENKIKFK